MDYMLIFCPPRLSGCLQGTMLVFLAGVGSLRFPELRPTVYISHRLYAAFASGAGSKIDNLTWGWPWVKFTN